MAKFRFTRTELKNIGIGSIVDNEWRIESYSHTGKNAIAHRVDKFARPVAPFTRVLLVRMDGEPVIEQKV